MNFLVIFFFIILQSMQILSQEIGQFLFEDHWQRENIHFICLSENIAPKISSEDMPVYEKFVQRCMKGHKGSLQIYTDHKKITFHCSDDVEELKQMVEEDKKKYYQTLEAIAEFMKQGKVATFKNLGKRGADCSMKAEVDFNWDKIKLVVLGYQLKTLAEQLKSGDFEIAGCKVHVIHFDVQGNIDQSTYEKY